MATILIAEGLQGNTNRILGNKPPAAIHCHPGRSATAICHLVSRRLGRAVRQHNGVQEFMRIGIVAKCLADVDEQVFISRCEDKTSAQLERIFPQLELAMSGGFRPLPRSRIVLAQQVKQARVAESHCLIGFTLFVDEKREIDLAVFAELASVGNVAQADRDKLRAFLLESNFVLAQLRDVLATEDSTVMTEKNDHCRTACPEASQLHRLSIDIRQRNAGQLAAVRVRHGDILRAGEGLCQARCRVLSRGKWPPNSFSVLRFACTTTCCRPRAPAPG
jgi:hypothetical protein